MPKRALVLLAQGFEEVEAVTPVDYLRRSGVEVLTAAVGTGRAVTGSHGIALEADVLFDGLPGEADDWDAVVIPGGLPGADKLAASPEAGAFITAMAAKGKWVSAICASPARVLFPLGLLEGRRFTCFPGEEERVIAGSRKVVWIQDPVVTDGNLITSRGAGTAGLFAVEIVSALMGREEGARLAARALLPGS
jgi:4-methyl-5(b-hydroxyethyl)-thiazole monophosphate biosynthesis